MDSARPQRWSPGRTVQLSDAAGDGTPDGGSDRGPSSDRIDALVGSGESAVEGAVAADAARDRRGVAVGRAAVGCHREAEPQQRRERPSDRRCSDGLGYAFETR